MDAYLAAGEVLTGAPTGAPGEIEGIIADDGEGQTA